MEGPSPGGGSDASAFFSAEGPLVCFTAVSHEESFVNQMGLISQRDTVLFGCNVAMHVNPVSVAAGDGGVVYTALIRVPGRVRAFLQKINEMSDAFRGNMLICDRRMTEQAFRVNGIVYKDTYFTVDSAQTLSVLLNMGMTDDQRRVIQDAIFRAPPGRGRRRQQRRGHRADWLPPQQLRNNRMVNRFFDAFLGEADARGMAAPPPPPPDMMLGSGIVFHNHAGSVIRRQGLPSFFNADQAILEVVGNPGGGGLTEAEAMALGVRISEQHAARTLSARRERQARDPRPDDLPVEWDKILKKGEPCEPGFPECLVCMCNKATILFTQCGHMVTCDDCVRRMFSDPGVASECPLCPGVRKTQIMRPHLSKGTAPESPPPPAKRKEKTTTTLKPRAKKKKRRKKGQ